MTKISMISLSKIISIGFVTYKALPKAFCHGESQCDHYITTKNWTIVLINRTKIKEDIRKPMK